MADAITSLQIAVEAKDGTTHVLKGIESSIIRFVGAVSASLAAVNVVLFPVRAAADFETELLNVAKTTEFSTDKIDTLAKGLKDMSYRLNVSAVDLAKVAAAGGQLGLGREGVDGLLAYTEATSRFSSVLNVTVEEAGTAIGKLSNLFKIGIADAERISSTINEVSNNSTASGKELLDIIQRIGTAGGTLNLQQSAALAAYGKDLGLTSETVGTTLNKVFLDLQTKAAAVAPLVGMPIREFANLVKTDGIAAFKLYINALNNMDNVTRNVLSEQITGGGRISAFVTAAISDAATGFKLLDRDLESTSRGFKTGTSAIKEQERVLTGLSAQLTILNNVFTGIAETIGRRALPYLTNLAKQAQEFGKDPSVQAFFDGMGESIGRVVVAAVDFVKAMTSISAVIGPLFTLLKVWLTLTIAQAIFGWSKALYNSGAAALSATTGWLKLITVNREAIRTMAEAAKQVEITNAALIAQGKTPPTQVGSLGKAATSVNNLFKPYWEAQDKVAQTEKALNATIAKRDQMLTTILDRMKVIKATSAATAQKAYDDAIASGSTKKSANALKKDVSVALKKEYDSLDVRGANLLTRYNDAVTKLNAAHLAAGKSAMVMGGTVGGVLAQITAWARGAATAVFAIGEGFLAVASRVLGVVFIVQYLLDLLGLLDPLMKFLRGLVGIRTEEEEQAQRASQARDKALKEEKSNAKALAEEYDKVADKWDKAIPDTSKTRLEQVSARLEIIQGKMKNIAFSTGDFVAGIAYSSSRVQTLAGQLEAAKNKLAQLQRDKPVADTLAVGQAVIAPVLGKDIDKTNRDIASAQIEVERLTVAWRLAEQAKKFYSESLSNAEAVKADVVANEAKVIKELAAAYNAEGYAMLGSLKQVLDKTQELSDAQKELDKATQKTDGGTTANAADLEAYTAASQKVQKLSSEVTVLEAGYKNMKSEASLAALAFVKALGVNETTASIGKLNKALATFGGISAGVTTDISARLADVTKEVKATQKALLEVESIRKSRLSSLSTLPDPNAEDAKKAARVIAEESDAQASALSRKLQDQLALQDNLTRELNLAKNLSTEYSKLGDKSASAKRQNKELIDKFIDSAAIVAFTSKQADAQRKLVEGAKFYAAKIKEEYETALKAVSTAIKAVADEQQGLVSYFATRRLTIKLASFDNTAAFFNDAFKQQQADALEEERKRLQTLGLSTEEINAQLRGYQQMQNFAAKMRQEVQDEQRQTIVLNDLKDQINKADQLSMESQKKATEYAKQAKDAAAAGNAAAATTFGEHAAVEAEKAKMATEELTAKVKEFKAEAAKPVSTPFGAKFIVSDQEVAEITNKAAQAKVQSSKVVANALEQAYQSASDATERQNAALKTMEDRIISAQAKVAEVVASVPELARVQGLVGEAVVKQAEGVAAIAESLKSIANTDFRGTTNFEGMAQQIADVKKVEIAIATVANNSSASLSDIVVKAKDLPLALREAYRITAEELAKADAAAEATKLRLSVQKAPVETDVTFPKAKESLQKSLDSGPPLQATVDLKSNGTVGAGAQRNAEGGHIRGPGTGTSDSILSWLSDGEYVSDAHTTSFFGPSFFSLLKRIARGGSAALSGFGSGLRLPAFANGGVVSSSMAGLGEGLASALAASTGHTMDTVKVEFTAGGKTFSLRSERDQANELARTLRNLSRSS